MATTLPDSNTRTVAGATTTRLPISLDTARGVVLSLTRIVVSFLFVCHGAKLLFGTFGGGHGMAFGVWPAWWAGAIEFFGGLLVMVGLFTTPAAVLCSGAMAYAYFTVHAPTGFFPIQNNGEMAAFYCWVFLLFAFAGPGPLAVSALWARKSRS
jgi:putative oxidoreductase